MVVVHLNSLVVEALLAGALIEIASQKLLRRIALHNLNVDVLRRNDTLLRLVQCPGPSRILNRVVLAGDKYFFLRVLKRFLRIDITRCLVLSL